MKKRYKYQYFIGDTRRKLYKAKYKKHNLWGYILGLRNHITGKYTWFYDCEKEINKCGVVGYREYKSKYFDFLEYKVL